ncbi:DUF2306 domain-containing protein [Sphingomicrobium flavum]|uniref:DUF2306 domain-containing protein n=1 Tax=Sphingomicrobium flavum TaxID=1229164 RepID=UPI0021AD6E5E|nr:DUF2306 domain-containing protein [Sphingomicrobium flavum]
MTASQVFTKDRLHGMGKVARWAIMLFAGGLTAIVLYGSIRWILGIAPPTPWVRDTALTIHLLTAVPAIPLGAYVLLSKKGDAGHKLLGRIWLTLMGITAFSTIWIRHINDGNFSWIHLFVILTFIAIPQSIMHAKRGDIVRHKKGLLGFYIGALVIAGITSFLPGRTMWQWVFY